MSTPDNPTETGGPTPDERESRRLARWFFFRCLSIVYIAAFWSLFIQFEGLIGEEGIVPAGDYLQRLSEAIGQREDLDWWQFPSIIWLTGASNFALKALCSTGLAFSVFLLLGIAPRVMLAALWILYLSFFTVSAPFLNYQWDILLLETTVLAFFYAPTGFRPRLREIPEPSTMSVWLLRLLLFKLILCSGLVKLNSGDPSWVDLSALDYHFWTQPLPHELAWFAHQMPEFAKQLGVLFNHFVELCVPFLILFNPRGRNLLIWIAVSFIGLYVFLEGFSSIHLLGLFTLTAILGGRVWPGGAHADLGRTPAALLCIVLMLTVALSGNYGFFNLLTIALCFTLFDDQSLKSVVPGFLHRERASAFAGPKPSIQQRLLVAMAAIILIPLSAFKMFPIVAHEQVKAYRTAQSGSGSDKKTEPTGQVLEWASQIDSVLGSYASVNRYGLFAQMTKSRYELQIEGSLDGKDWRPYTFVYKPNSAAGSLKLAGLHMPRLDWQMWFAALRPTCNQRWFFGFLKALARGSEPVEGLLHHSPFAGTPPTQLRVKRFRAQFTDRETGPGEPWLFEKASDYCPVVSMKDLERVVPTPTRTE